MHRRRHHLTDTFLERRRVRARLREERAFRAVLAAAPTLESAHELRALATRR
jgi:hypothetical protein